MENIKISLGKINLNRIKTLINEIEFKGKTRTEIKTYLGYTTGEYKESKTNLTDIFGNIDQEVLTFLNAIYEKYPEINESNFKEVMTELNLFSDTYQYKIKDIRQTKEELISQRTEREAEQKKAEEKKAEEEAEIKASGNLTDHEKINLGTKEIAKRIRNTLKERFKDCVFSVVMESYSGGSSISIYLMQSNFKVMQDFKDLSEEAITRYLDDGMRTREQLKTMQETNYNQLNHNIEEEYNKDVWNNGIFLTEAGYNLFKEVCEIVNYYNYDHSDAQTDYFDTNFYLHLNIGKYDKPYICEVA